MPAGYDDTELRDLFFNKFPQALDKLVELTAVFMWGEIGREAPVGKTGLLSGSFQIRDGRTPYSREIHSHVEYLWWVHEGTGIYGPHKRRITPVRAKALRFYWRRLGEVVFFKSVAGQPPDRFIDRAIETTKPRIQEFGRKAMREVMGP